MSTHLGDAATEAVEWLRQHGFEVVLRDRSADDVGGRHQPEIDLGIVWWCDLVATATPEVVLDGFGIAVGPDQAVLAARRRWETEAPDPHADEITVDMLSAIGEEFTGAVTRPLDIERFDNTDGEQTLEAAGLAWLAAGQWFMPPTNAQRDALVVAANAVLETTVVTAAHIDAWIAGVRWRWPTTMDVLEYDSSTSSWRPIDTGG